MSTELIYFSNAGAPATGLTLTWEYLLKVSDGTAYAQPSFTEVGGGWYKYTINPTEDVVGVIDGSDTLTDDADRYKSVSHKIRDYNSELVVIPVYDEDSDTLTFAVFLLIDGIIVTTTLTSCTISVYDTSHSLSFTVIEASNTNGIFILTKSSPSITANRLYYVLVSVTHNGVVHSSADTYISLE